MGHRDTNYFRNNEFRHEERRLPPDMTAPDAATPAEQTSIAARKASVGADRPVAGLNSIKAAARTHHDPFLSPAGPIGRIIYESLYALGSILLGMLLPTRVTGANVVPKTGPFLLIANHGSYLDPPLLGHTCYRRRMHYLAMSGLFKFPPFRWLISSLGAIPIERIGNAGPGLKASLKCLSEGHGLVIFPEGSRSPDGELHQFKRGVMLVIRKAKVPVVVAGIAGAFDCWPIFKKLPILGPIWVHYTTWQWPEGADEDAALAHLYQTVRGAMDVAERGWRRIGGKPMQPRTYKVEDFPD
jgi:1-acyl-sn-glycerol-3-phosphate acyltransferase